MIWVAEIGSMHQGNKSLAYELIRKAKWAGATIAKFQLGWDKEAQFKYAGDYDERRFIDPWAEDLAKWCADMDIEFMASIWSTEGLEVARSVGMKRYKIAHQLRGYDLIDAIYDEAEFIYHSISNEVGFYPVGSWSNRILVYTEDNYPTYENHYRNFDFKHKGYSSHMHGIADALIAVTRGAEYIEKHLTLDKTLSWPRDASFALDPTEFRQMVDIGSEIARIR